MNFSHSGLIRVIAFFKLLKAACLIAVGFGVLKLVHTDVAAKLEHWVAIFGFDPGGRLISHAIQRVTNFSPARIKELGVVSFVYAGLFTTEGIGLWRTKALGRVVHGCVYILTPARRDLPDTPSSNLNQDPRVPHQYRSGRLPSASNYRRTPYPS